jgi:hypothetical protein
MMICGGMAVNRMGTLRVSVRKMGRLTGDGDSDTEWYRQMEYNVRCVLSGTGRWNITCIVY